MALIVTVDGPAANVSDHDTEICGSVTDVNGPNTDESVFCTGMSGPVNVDG